MGADLYIKAVYDENHKKYEVLFQKAVAKRNLLEKDSIEEEKAQKLVSKYYDLMYSKGYFRDSYNGTSLMWAIGLSWWKDIPRYTNKAGNITPTRAKELKKVIQNSEIKITKERLIELHCEVDDDKNSVDVWKKYFQSKKRRFIAFLDLAIKLKSEIECSC